MKIKEICEKTGLTDRTVRYYIEEGLISPFYTENYLGRKAFDFSEQDLDRLKSIATLRSFGFTVEEIKALSLGDADSKQIVDAVKQRASESLDESQRRMHVLRELDLSSEGDLLELSRKLYDRDMAIRNENVRPDPKKRILSFLRSCAIFLAVWLPILLAGIVLVVKIAVLDMPIVRPVCLFCTVLCFLPSLFIALILKKTNETKKAHRILTLLCLICLPLSIAFSWSSIITCEHGWEPYHTVSSATCSREGEAVFKCNACNGFTVQKLEKLPHQTVVTKGYAPTCSRTGLSDGSYCSVCSEVLAAQDIIPKIDGHIPVVYSAVEATCSQDGLTEGKYCDICDEILVPQIAIPKKEHTLVNGFCTVCRAHGSNGLTYSVQPDNASCIITGIGTCTDTELWIANTVDGYTVTGIAKEAFERNQSITEVIFPDTLTTIGDNAFGYCTNLKRIYFSDSLIKISDSAFQRCSKLDTISGSDSVFLIEKYAFYGCSSLTRIDFPNVKQYGNYAFGGCSLLESVTLSEDVTVLPQSIFADCTSLTSITLPAALTTVGNAAFQRTAITEIVLPDSVETVEMYAFSCCYDLQTIILSANLKSIDTMVFEQCDALQKVEIPNKVTSIPRMLFFSCSSLTEVVLPDSVISMGDGVFVNCGDLRSVVLPKGLTHIPESTFSSCAQLESVQLPPNIKRIDRSAFFACSSLKEIVIPNSCVSIGGIAFYGCKSLEKVTFGNSITDIGDSAFSSCSIKEAILPDTLDTIGSFAFRNCTALTTVYLGNSITNIEYQAFANCTALKTVFLPKSLRSISPASYDISPFNDCSAELRLYSDMETGSAVWQSYFGLVNYGYSYQAYLQKTGAQA